MRPIFLAALAALLPALPATADAQMTPEADQAAAGSCRSAMPHMPHGCDGQATEAVEVTIPEGLIAVKPMPKPDCALATQTGPYARPYDNHGQTLTKAVRAIRWTGGARPDAHCDEFILRARLAGGLVPGTFLPVMAVQRCATAEARWDEVAGAGQEPRGLDRPGPLLRVAPPAPTGHDVLAGAAGHGGMAGSATLGDLTIRGAVARASIGNAPTSAAYMTITTTGEPDRLVAASSPAAQAVELHTSLQEAGVSKMEHLEAVPVSADAPAELAPGGHHIMLIGLASPLEEGETVPLTLTFEKAGEITLDVPVSKNIAAHAH